MHVYVSGGGGGVIPSFVRRRDMCSALFFFSSLIFIVDRLSQSLVSSVSMLVPQLGSRGI